MANPVSIARRQALAYRRILNAASGLERQYGLSTEVAALQQAHAKDPAYAQMLQTEALATLIERLQTPPEQRASGLRTAIVNASDEELMAIPGIGEKSLETLREWAATEPEPQPAETPQQPGRTGDGAPDEDAPQGDEATQPPVTVETVTEKPMETTETVQIVEGGSAPQEDVPVVPRRGGGRNRTT